MSVAVARQPQLPSFNRTSRVHNPAPRPSSVVARGIIRLPKDVLPTQQGARQTKPRHRRSPKSSSVDPKAAANAVDKADDLIQPIKGHSTTPKRPSRDAASSRKPISPSTPRVSNNPKPRAKQFSQAETINPDTSDSDVSQTSLIPEFPSTPASNNSKKRPTSFSSTLETNGNINKDQHQNSAAKNSRSRRGGHRSNQTPATAALSIPTPSRGRDSSRAPIPDQFMSRSVPSSGGAGSALPDWDLPPSFSSRTDPFIVEHEGQVVKPARVSRSESPEARLPIVPWLEFQEDHVYTAMASATTAISSANSQSTPDVRLTSQHRSSPSSNSIPCRSGRPTNRHARTVSVPSLSTLPFVQKEQQPSSPKVVDSSQVKYAGGRFQSAPAPTFLPMPSFVI